MSWKGDTSSQQLEVKNAISPCEDSMQSRTQGGNSEGM